MASILAILLEEEQEDDDELALMEVYHGNDTTLERR